MNRDIGQPPVAPARKARPKRAPAQSLSQTNLVTVELQRLAAIVEGSDDAIIGETLEGKITSWNEGATRMFGYTAEEMVGHSVARTVPRDLRKKELGILARLARGEHVDRFDTMSLGKDACPIAVTVTLSPLRDSTGKVVGAVRIVRDQSERTRNNEAVRNANEAVQRARLEAEGASFVKTEFLAVMSHEIRTPLNAITGFVDLLKHSAGLTPQQHRYAELVQTANASLLTIVNDILDFSKIEAGHLELELRPFSLTNLIDDMMATVLPSATPKSLLLRCRVGRGVPDWVTGDKARVRQVLLNLLNNAVKFTDRGSIAVDVSPQIAADGRERIFFSIADTGIGIPAAQQHRLFKPFSQADSSVSRKHGGTGLGLAICKQLIELMDGEIGITSDLGRGTTAWFSAVMPRAPAHVAEPEIEPLLEDGGETTFRILVVDDIDTNLEIAEAYLQDCGYQVDCVTSGPEAIQSLGSVHYDLILMDIQMPLMDGVTTTKRIRELPAPLRDIPIIAMTGNVLPQQVRAFLEAGMNDHVSKPIERAKLYNNIRRWLPAAKGERVRNALSSSNFDRVKFDEFFAVVGAEKAERIVNKFLEHLADAFKSTFEKSQREAHGLINTAGVLGLDSFVEACRHAAGFGPSPDPERCQVAIAELQRAQSAAHQTLAIQLLPRLRGERSRFAA